MGRVVEGPEMKWRVPGRLYVANIKRTFFAKISDARVRFQVGSLSGH